MKKQLGIVILVVVCVGLVIVLIAGKKQADTQREKDADTILNFSNQLTTASANIDELRQVNLALTNDLDATRQSLVTYSNQYVATSALLSNTKTTLETAQDQNADLKAQNQTLDQRASGMSNIIANLSAQITETQIKFVKSETNNAFLQDELKRQMAKRAELERRFHIRPLDDNLSVEVSSEGSVKIVPTPTNMPSSANSLHP
jgi:chromosome segregation ATPase